jgi:hypothetical protein
MMIRGFISNRFNSNFQSEYCNKHLSGLDLVPE